MRLRCFAASISYCKGEQIYDENGNSPAGKNVKKHKREAKEDCGFIENLEKREVQQNDAQDKEDDPGFP
jgi:hypothetical protein